MTSSSIQTAVTSLGGQQYYHQLSSGLFLSSPLILGLAAGVLAIWTKGGEKLAESIFRIFACVSVGSVVIITVYMIVSGAPAIAEIGLGNFLFGTEWGAEKRRLRNFALDTLLHRRYCGSSDYRCSHRNFNRGFSVGNRSEMGGSVVRPAVQLLAGIPRWFTAFFGWRSSFPRSGACFGQTIGDSLLAVILILAIMVLPHHCQVSETSLRGGAGILPGGLRPWAPPGENYLYRRFPPRNPEFWQALFLGVGRAIGETMAVIMVA